MLLVISLTSLVRIRSDRERLNTSVIGHRRAIREGFDHPVYLCASWLSFVRLMPGRRHSFLL
jgi:hypothetical protein